MNDFLIGTSQGYLLGPIVPWPSQVQISWTATNIRWNQAKVHIIQAGTSQANHKTLSSNHWFNENHTTGNVYVLLCFNKELSIIPWNALWSNIVCYDFINIKPMAVTLNLRWFQKVKVYPRFRTRQACSNTIKLAADPNNERFPLPSHSTEPCLLLKGCWNQCHWCCHPCPKQDNWDKENMLGLSYTIPHICMV